MSRWARAALFAVGCGHAAPAPGPTPGTPPPPAHADAPPALDDDLPRLATRAVELFKAWDRALAKAGEDCGAATSALNQLALDYADVIAANQRIAHAGHDRMAALRAELAKHDEELDAAAERIAHSVTMSACAADPKFAHAVDRIGGAPP